jgi:hypothetical protein
VGLAAHSASVIVIVTGPVISVTPDGARQSRTFGIGGFEQAVDDLPDPSTAP